MEFNPQQQLTLAGKAKNALASAKNKFNSTIANAQSTTTGFFQKFKALIGEKKEEKGQLGGRRRRRTQKRGRKSRHHKKHASLHHKKRSARRHRGSRKTRH